MDINGRVIWALNNSGNAAAKEELKASDDFMAAMKEHEKRRQAVTGDKQRDPTHGLKHHAIWGRIAE